MKVYNETSDNRLDAGLQEALLEIRKVRNFDAGHYVETKAFLLNDYLRKSKLSSCVIAVSGGIDSAVVLGIVNYAFHKKDSPIKKVVPLMLPVFNSSGTTNQDVATKRAEELTEKLGLEKHIIDLSSIQPLLKKEVDEKLGIVGDNWASGQLVAYLRTPSIYYTTSLMSQNGTPGVVVGTTNRDEGAYLGYVGKASDGMVDVQLISDLHKSEVYKVARHLELPQSILDAIPTGDMYDGRVDEEVFGASYDFVELYLSYLSFLPTTKKFFYERLSDNAKKQFDFYASHLENLHSYNKHKYVIGSPAVHLDILQSDVPGGWSIQRDNPLDSSLDFSKINGYFEFPNSSLYSIISRPYTSPRKEELLTITPSLSVALVRGLLEQEQCQILRGSLEESKWVPVGADGYKNSKLERVTNKGSERQTIYNKELADYIWKSLSKVIPTTKVIHQNELGDAQNCAVWRAVGVSPLFRFIRYRKGDLLIPHYDSPYVYDDKTSTLMTLVIYLTSNDGVGGETRFIKDNQTNLQSTERNYNDWDRLAKDDEVLYKNACVEGDALVMDHRILHDSACFTGEGYKLIIRTDIIYTKCIQY